MRALLVAAALVLCAAPLPGYANDDREGDAAVVFARGSSLWVTPLEPGAEARELATLDHHAGTIERIAATARGEVILAETPDDVLVATPRHDEVVGARSLPCQPPAYLGAEGDAVLCRRGDATLRVDLEVPLIRVLSDAGGRPVGFWGTNSDSAIVAGDDAMCAVSLKNARRRCLAPHSPSAREALIAPSGKRAVARYRRGDRPALYTFQLDGRGVRRALMSRATAVSWSADSEWLAVQRGRRACLVRALGGQYTCWRRYRAVAVAPEGQRILLTRGNPPRSLFVAPLAGPRPTPPDRLVERAGRGAGAWISAPQPYPAPASSD